VRRVAQPWPLVASPAGMRPPLLGPPRQRAPGLRLPATRRAALGGWTRPLLGLESEKQQSADPPA